MKALLPVNSERTSHPLETILVNASRIGQSYGVNLPIVVAKVKVKLISDCEWSLYVEECGSKTPLLNDEDVKASNKKVDLLETLGHPLILFGYQKLCFYSSNGLVSAVSFIDVSSKAIEDSTH